MRKYVLMVALAALLVGASVAPVPAEGPARKPEAKPEERQYLCEAAIAAPDRVPEHRLVLIKQKNKIEDAWHLWDVTPEDTADVLVQGDTLILTAPPGTYRIRLTVLKIKDGRPQTPQVCRHTLVVERSGQQPPAPPSPGPGPGPGTPKPPEGGTKPNPAKALGRIQFGNAGCTATPIWPRRSDGKWDIITAAHCMTGVGARGIFTAQDGRRIPVRVTVHEKGSDLAWLVTESPVESLEYALLAKQMPQPGSKVWHAGYGVDRPGNREEGELVNPEAGQYQATYMISVSSGDSGGGIFSDATGEWLGAVCCTRAKGVRATVWAGHALRAAALRPGAATDVQLLDKYIMPRAAEHPILITQEKETEDKEKDKKDEPASAPAVHPVECIDPTTGRVHPILITAGRK
jgi:hypothetical protein